MTPKSIFRKRSIFFFSVSPSHSANSSSIDSISIGCIPFIFFSWLPASRVNGATLMFCGWRDDLQRIFLRNLHNRRIFKTCNQTTSPQSSSSVPRISYTPVFFRAISNVPNRRWYVSYVWLHGVYFDRETSRNGIGAEPYRFVGKRPSHFLAISSWTSNFFNST